MSETGRRIREKRTEMKRSLSWLAKAAGVSKSHLCDIEKGRKGMGAEVLLNIALALGVTMESLTSTDALGRPAEAVAVPSELAALAESQRLPFRAVLAMMGVWRVIEAYREKKGPPDWALLWAKLGPFITGDTEQETRR